MKDENAPLSSYLLEGFTRRSFLKTSAAAAAVSSVPATMSAEPARRKELPPIPRVEDLAGAPLRHRMRDLYMSPTAQNELGYAQASKSVTGITGIAFPPYGCCGVPAMAWSPGFLLTCELFLNGRVLMACPGGDEIAYRWFPHQIMRATEVEGIRFSSRMFLPSRKRAVAQSISIKNVTRATKKFTFGLYMRAAVAKRTAPWFGSEATMADNSGEADNSIRFDEGRLVFQARHSEAVSVQGVLPKANRLESECMLVFDLELQAGETKELRYVNAIGPSMAETLALYDDVQEHFSEMSQENERVFNGLLKNAFTPDNSDFSGHLPKLETDSEALWDLYMAGVRNLIFARRASPDSAYGTTYVTLGGKVHPTLSFPWDTALTSVSLALLDPDALRRLTETWLSIDLHQCLATDHVSGKGVGPWYASNDMSVVRCAQKYLQVTGDLKWLDHQIAGKSVLDHLVEHALYWKQLDKSGHGLADYGAMENQLEVVSTYLYETAGMNAGNVASMRFVADLLERRGDSARASQLRLEARDLAQRINQKLYVQGKGFWKCGQPDGSFTQVRHCYDLLSVLDNMFEDLTATQKQEMSRLFWEEFQTEYWMRALSPDDGDATWNIRPDHSWLGAYAAWPPATARGLYKIDPSARLAAWLTKVAKVTNQGPVGQAHFTEMAFPLEAGAAYKCPTDAPYLNDWCCISGGGFTDLVIDTIFGAEMTLFNGVNVTSRLAEFDPKARLLNLRHQGKNFTISAKGATAEK